MVVRLAAGSSGSFLPQFEFCPRSRMDRQGITHSASRLGAAITPPLVVLIMTTLGWRWVFYICAAVGIVWSALWYLAYRNLPEEHGLVNKAELEHIRGIDEAGNVNAPKIETKTSVPWATLLR